MTNKKGVFGGDLRVQRGYGATHFSLSSFGVFPFHHRYLVANKNTKSLPAIVNPETRARTV